MDSDEGSDLSEAAGEQDMSSDDSAPVYKAPKKTAVAYEDKATKKLKQKSEYEDRRTAKSSLI